MSWNEDSRKGSGWSGVYLHGADPRPRGEHGSDMAVLTGALEALTQHTQTSIVLFTSALRIRRLAGPLFNAEDAEAVQVHDDAQRLATVLGDRTLEQDLTRAFAGDAPASHTVFTRSGLWLYRSVDLVDGGAIALVGYRDVTTERCHEFLQAGQRLVIDAVARHERPEDIFRSFAQLIESCSGPGIHASVLWLQGGVRRLRHLASPSLPQFFVDAIDGVTVGPQVGACGSAVFLRQRVITEDIAADPAWEGFRDKALKAGLRACWSQPIFGSDGAVLGAFALYRETVGRPTAPELRMLDLAVQTAAIAMRDLRAEDETQFQNALLDSVREPVVATDAEGLVRHWSRGAEHLIGYSATDVLGRPLVSVIELTAGLDVAVATGSWTGEVRVRTGRGSLVTLDVSLFEVSDRVRGRRGFVGILRDVTHRKAEEERLVSQNLRHRVVAYLGRLALSDLDLQSLMAKTVELLAEVLDVPLCKILELDPSGDSLLMRAGVGWAEGLVGKASVCAARGSQAGYTLASAGAVVVEDLASETRFSGPPLLVEHGVVSGMSVVILGDGDQAYGVLGVHTRQRRRFTPDDVDFLQSVANLLSQSIRRKQADEALRMSEQRFRDLADAMPHVVWSADAAGCADYFNERWCRLGGARPGKPDFDAWRGLIHPEDLPDWTRTWEHCIATGSLFEMECRVYVEQAGAYRWHLARAVPVRGPSARPLRWYGSSTDIDEQKRTEHQLIEQARRLELINWINSALAAELELESLVQRVVEVGTRLSGAAFGGYFQRSDEAPGYRLFAVAGTPPDDFDAMLSPCVAAMFDRAADATRCEDGPAEGDGHPGWISVRSCLAIRVVSRTGETLGGMFFGHTEPGVFDIDDEQAVRGLAAQAAIAVDNANLYRALRESKDQIRRQLEQIDAIYATAPVGLCYLDAELRVVSMNVHLKALTGWADAEASGYDFGAVFGPVADALRPVCREVVHSRTPLFDREVQWRAGDSGEIRYWLCGAYPILGDGGAAQGVNTVVQDITARKLAELELARLGEIVAGSYDAIIGKTLDGIITSWNRGAERVYGYTAEEAVGKPIAILLPEDRRGEGSEILTALRCGTFLQFTEAQRVRKDGEIISVSMTVSPIRDASGVVIGASTIGRDITAQKRAEQAIRESEARMRFILRSTRVGTWDWDMRTNQVRWSENLEELHGRARGSFQGTFESVLADVHPEDKALIDAAVAKALNGTGDYNVEYRVVTADGQTRWIEGKGQLICSPDGDPERMAGICMDVTERKEAEQALRINDTLLRAQTEELATAHRQKDEFLAMLAHELRNPLAPISNSVQLLKIQGPEQRERTLPWAIDVIDRQVSQISRLVDDLLDVARITRGHIELRPEYLDLSEVVARAAEAAAPWFEAKKQNFEVNCTSEPVPVLVDAVRMVQVIANLLNNASKFTPERGIIRLRLQRDRDEAILCVADTGVGISPDILPHVFELFTQGDRSLDRRQGGLGLGLPLVRRLVEMHEGRVVAISPGMGRGSEFVIRLPLSLAAGITDEQRETGPAASSESRPMRILVVDDNAQSADAMAVLLETLGHEATAVYNGPAALRMAEHAPPEIVFLDIGLPLMDGYEVAAALRKRYGPAVTLVALSGYAPRHAEVHQRSSDFDHYILKPISFDDLRMLLNRQVSRK